jgi:hypothetical protein
MWHTAGFEDTIRTIYAQDHDARFVLIGFSLGANCIRALANHLHEDGDVPVDLMMYLGGNTLKDDAHSQPPNVKRFVNVLAWGFIWNGAEMGQADNVHVEDVWHFGSPTHPETLQRLSAALAEVGSAVHFIQPPPPPVLHPEPTPRPVAATARVAADEWDFLRPMGDLPQFTAPAGAPALVSFQ